MDRLTPNLWAFSAFFIAATATQSRELDFNLARRSGIIINKIVSQMFMLTNVTSGHSVDMGMVQELDTDPDNIATEFAGSLIPVGAVLDSSRMIRHRLNADRDTAAGVESTYHTELIKDWTNEPESKRPISITPIRHHLNVANTLAFLAYGEINIDYFIVELSLEEIGIINASRR